jgi:hypothetical protein
MALPRARGPWADRRAGWLRCCRDGAARGPDFPVLSEPPADTDAAAGLAQFSQDMAQARRIPAAVEINGLTRQIRSS